MPIEISTQIIHNSYAAVINKIDPKANIYDNPNQQGTAYPAWFIVHRSPVEVQREFGKRMNGNCYMLTYQIDIWYMIQQNIPRLYDQYTAIAERFDSEIEYLPIFGSNAIVHVYDRSWSLELNAMKYSTTLKLRVFADKNFVFTPMEVIDDLSVFLKNQNQSVITFENTTHPEFDAQIPSPISVTKGQSVNLPFVGGEFEDDDYKWTPSGWSIGAFGARIRLDESITTNLLWSSTEKTATLSFENTIHPEFSVQMPESITANKGTSVELPTVSGTFPVGSVDWTPSAWSVGSFGDSFILDEDTTTDLQWRSDEVQFTLSFSNSNHPEFDVDLPQAEQITRGDSVTLPSVSGSFIEDGYEWTPDSWDIGAFGDSYTPSSDVIANLLWRSVAVWPTVSLHGDFGSDNWLYADSSQSSSVSVASNSQIGLLLDRSYQTYDDSKSYAVQQWYVNSSTVGTTGDFIIAKQGLTQIAAKNVSSSTKYILKARVAICSSNQATVVTVYNSNNNPFNAFKYTVNDTDYYYVLDDVQTDWTDDLESIGFSLNPLFEEFTLYCEASMLNYMRNITSSSVITGASTSYRKQLFLNSSRTTPFPFNTSKRYVKGRYISGVWTPDPVQSIADMPSTTTSVSSESVAALIVVGVDGTTIGVSGNAWILAITNYTGYNSTTSASPYYVRVYDSEQQQYQTGWMTSNKSATTLSGDNYLYGNDGFIISASSSNTYTIVALYSSESGAPFTDSSLYLRVVGGKLNIVDPNYRSYTIQRVEYEVT